MDVIQVLLPAWRASKKNSFSPFDTQVPSQRTLVLNIVNSFKTDNSNASSFGNSMEVVLVPTFPVRARQLSGWSSFNAGFQWPLNRTLIEPSCEVRRLRKIKGVKPYPQILWLGLSAWGFKHLQITAQFNGESRLTSSTVCP